MGSPAGIPRQPEASEQAALSLAARHLERVPALPLSHRQLQVREGRPELLSSLLLPPLESSGLSPMAASAPVQEDATLELEQDREW